MSRLLAKMFFKQHKKALPSVGSLNSMGLCNGPWGICGFTSSLYALHTNSPAERQLELGEGGQSPTRMLAEIKTYLRLLQACGGKAILDSIRDFTQSFAGFETWTITDYIERVNSVVLAKKESAYVKDDKFGIGMPPDAVVDYLQRVCDFPKARVIDLGSDAPEMILGMGTTKLGMPMYSGLGHYIYSLNSKIHSWGLEFSDPQTAMDGVAGVAAKDWQVVYKIAVK